MLGEIELNHFGFSSTNYGYVKTHASAHPKADEGCGGGASAEAEIEDDGKENAASVAKTTVNWAFCRK